MPAATRNAKRPVLGVFIAVLRADGAGMLVDMTGSPSPRTSPAGRGEIEG
jgi:hypothetical protein